MQFKQRGMKWLRVLHLISGGVWFGATAAIAGLTIVAFFQSTETEFLVIAPLISFLFQKIAGPLALFVLIQGVIYGCWTKWGFFKHHWLLLKWLCIPLLIFSIAFGSIGQLFTARTKVDAGTFSGGFADGGIMLIFISFQLLTMIFMIWASVFKPWKKTRRQKAPQRKEADD
ncbi:MAG: hypothetical protein FWF88_06770 [Peptococcaceae bacterium]|nr:hypothetical protein [Peptococcaceae bacterium]